MRTLALATTAFALALPWTAPTPHRSADDAVARVADAQGMAFFRPLARERWTPLGKRGTLVAGDSLRTSPRGANAVELRLRDGTRLTAGPGVLLRVLAENELELVTGDIELKTVKGKASAVRVKGPGDFSTAVDDVLLLRADGRSVEKLAEPPRWLTGYRASATSEWLGSLIANVDGRDVALTIGSIKISIEIRDQIARTTIEEAFQNNTDSTLEGVFRFPLPADASISGFGMWIGDELVEADIVEKQRARRIYEQILRERRDPGLLEWAGGNMFKARVFPIFPRSKKRIRIRYTQVLPLEGKTLRYRYPLRSELLAKFPLDELVIDAKVWSGAKLASLTSPTHAIQASTDGETASARFDAQKVSPDRDFELRAELAEVPPLRLVPHRRGDDGYFMALVNAPGESAGAWQRTLAPDGRPIELVLVADVSGSMDARARKTQHDFVEGILNLLGEKDRFRLLTSDASVHQFGDSSDALPANTDSVSSALDWLSSRVSLGWTDLDATFARVAELTTEDSIVVYVGDGVDTAGDGDPAALAERLRTLYGRTPASYHAVHPSSSYEKLVLEAIASLGNGSVRGIDGQSAASDAVALLREARSPALEDLSIRFEGLRTARVYPEVLPRLPRGMQQVVLGRFLPTTGTQTGRVLVTGKFDGKPVEFSRDVTIEGSESGNSFVPRLWARSHIESLLAADSSATMKEQIVAFSEEFGVMTPFTSFLVLESDEDRERFGVERRVKMRDGEDFFSAARDRATETLLREQLEKVRGWRRNLQRAMYRELADLGRSMHVAIADVIKLGMTTSTITKYGGRTRGRNSLGVPMGGGGGYRGPSDSLRFERAAGEKREADQGRLFDARMDRGGFDLEELEDEEQGGDADNFAADYDVQQLDESLKKVASEAMGPSSPGPARARRQLRMPASKRVAQSRFAYRDRVVPTPASASLSQLGFPDLQAPPTEPEPYVSLLPADIREILLGLDRRDRLFAATGAARLRVLDESLHPVRSTLIQSQATLAIFGPNGWLSRWGGDTREVFEHYLFDERRGVLNVGRNLGRRRPATKQDRRAFRLALLDSSFDDPARTYAQTVARVIARDGDRVTIEFILGASGAAAQRVVLEVDSAQRRLLSQERYAGEKLLSRTRFSDFVSALGSDWARKTEVFDEKGRLTRRVVIQIDELSAEQSQIEMASMREKDARAIYAASIDPALDDAKEARFAGRADVLELLLLVTHYRVTQRWKLMAEALEAASSKATAPAAIEWIRATYLHVARTGAKFQSLILEMATKAPRQDGAIRHWYANTLWNLAQNRLATAEKQRLLDLLRPAFTSPATDANSIERLWGMREATLLQERGRLEELASFLAKLQASQPWAIDIASMRARNLAALGRYDKARLLWSSLTAKQDWSDSEIDALYRSRTDYLWELRNFAEVRTAVAEWTQRRPTVADAWQRWLSTMLFSDRAEEADQWVLGVFGSLPEKLSDTHRAKLRTGISYAYARGWHYSANRLTPEWSERLLAVALELLRRDEPALIREITSQWRWRQQSDVAATLVTRMKSELLATGRIAALSLDGLRLRLDNLRLGKGQLEEAAWRQIHVALIARWRTRVAEGVSGLNERQQIAMLVLRHCDGQGMETEALAFARTRLDAATKELGNRYACADELWNRILRQKDRQTVQHESLALLPSLIGHHPKDDGKTLEAGRRIRQLCDRVYALLYLERLGEEAKREDLSRAALRSLQQSARPQAAEELATWLRSLDSMPSAHTWARLEAAGYDAKRKAPKADKAALLAQSAQTGRSIYAEADEDPRKPGARLLRERSAILVAYCGARSEAGNGLKNEIFAWLTQALPQTSDAPSDPASAIKPPVEDLDGRYHIARFLLAADRIAQLEVLLDSWIVPNEAASRWRILAGYLMAERRQLDRAIALFEVVRSRDELQPEDLRALADWKLVKGDRAARAEAMRAMAFAMSTNELQSRVSAERNRVTRRGSGPAPSLNAEIFVFIDALLAKSSYPQNEIWNIRRLYDTTKDHRILESLPWGVIGHTQQAVYGYLQRVGQILSAVHEEATCDRLDTAIVARLEAAENDLDRRALRLLRALVRGRAADVRNAPGPHIEVAVAALRESFDPDKFGAGEARLRATFLRRARLSGSALTDERLRQLRSLFERSENGTPDQLFIGLAWAEMLHAKDASRARDVLAQALDSRVANADGQLPVDARTAWQRLESWLIAARQFATAERIAMRYRESSQAHDTRTYLEQRLTSIRIAAVREGGRVSLGSGKDLYASLRTSIERDVVSCPQRQFSNLVQNRINLAKAAKKARLDGAGEDFGVFANQLLPELVRMLPFANRYRQVGETLREIVSPYAAVEFAVARLRDQPTFWRRLGYDVWSQLGYRVASWRAGAGVLGKLEAPLVELVCAELERDLISLESRSNSMWWITNRYFWTAHRADFGQVVDRVLELHGDSPARIAYATNYLWNGLHYFRRAVDARLAAELSGKLREQDRRTLATWCLDKRVRRPGEALRIADALLEQDPLRLDDRLIRIKALRELGRHDASRAEILATEKLFRDQKRLDDNSLQRLAEAATLGQAHDLSVRFWQELVTRRDKALGGVARPDSTMSYYHHQLASGLMKLERWNEAFASIRSAIVTAGKVPKRVQEAMSLLDRLLKIGPLETLIAQHDADVEKSGQDAPILRKAFGRSWLTRRDHNRAIAQLRLATELQDDDPESWQLLIQAHDAAGDARGALTAFQDSLGALPFDLKRASEYAKRLDAMNESDLAERAWTNLVEKRPDEAESHRTVARWLERKQRWKPARRQWKRVVSIRSEEPEGWFSLVAAQVESGEVEAARQTLKSMMDKSWEGRFGDVKSKIATQLKRLD